MARQTLKFSAGDCLDKYPELADFVQQTDAIAPLGIPNRNRVLILLRRDLLEACHGAIRYINNKGDPYKKAREEGFTFNRDVHRTRQQTIEILRFLHAHPNHYIEVAARWLATLKDHGVQIGGEMSAVDLLDAVFFSLKEVFDSDFLGLSVQFSGRIHHRAHGCILLGRSASKCRPPSLETMLAFNLVLLIRKASLGEYVTTEGEFMPERGDSHYKFVARLINTILGTELQDFDVGSRLRAFLRRNPTARLLDWP